MDHNHNVRENLNKVEALIDAVNKLYQSSNDLTISSLLFQLESLKALSDETHESLETLRTVCKSKK